MNKFLKFLYSSPLGTIVKVAVGAAIVYIADNITAYNVPAVLQVAIVACVPYIINWLNPEDPRYGKAAD